MDTSQILMMLNDKLPKDNPMVMQALSDELKSLDEKQITEVMQNITIANLKSPAKVFWIGSFLFGNFGVGRFMIGDSVIGAVRLGLLVLLLVCSGVANAFHDSPSALIAFVVLTIVLYIAIGIWWIVDLFLVGKKLRNMNLQKVQQIIMSVKK